MELSWLETLVEEAIVKEAKDSFNIGDEVSTIDTYGVNKNKKGKVVDFSKIKKTDRLIADVGQGHYKPIDKKNEVAVQYEDSSYDVIPKMYLKKEQPKGNKEEAPKEENKVDKVNTKQGYDFYIGKDSKGKPFYNAVPEGTPAPSGGYPNKDYILNVKGIEDGFEKKELGVDDSNAEENGQRGYKGEGTKEQGEQKSKEHSQNNTESDWWKRLNDKQKAEYKAKHKRTKKAVLALLTLANTLEEKGKVLEANKIDKIIEAIQEEDNISNIKTAATCQQPTTKVVGL